MDTGMMWFEDDKKKNLATRVMEAAKYYHDKYHAVATACLVNPKDLPAGKMEVHFIQVKTDRSVLPNQLWIGVEKEQL